MAQPIVTSSPEILSGAAVFASTRVPVQALVDSLESDETIDDFLAGFPTVERAQVVALLEEAMARMKSVVKVLLDGCVHRRHHDALPSHSTPLGALSESF